MIGPVHHQQRRASTVNVIFDCRCGFAERWRLPILAHPGRCTCPQCGQQMHERAQIIPAAVAYRSAA